MDICPPTRQGALRIRHDATIVHDNAKQIALWNDGLASGASPLRDMSLLLQEETSESQLIAR